MQRQLSAVFLKLFWSGTLLHYLHYNETVIYINTYFNIISDILCAAIDMKTFFIFLEITRFGALMTHEHTFVYKHKITFFLFIWRLTCNLRNVLHVAFQCSSAEFTLKITVLVYTLTNWQ